MLGPVFGGPLLFTIAIIEGHIGWRISTLILGIGVWVIGIPLSLVVRTDPASYGYLPDNAKPNNNQDSIHYNKIEDTNGMSVSEAIMTSDFWILSILFALMFLGISGLMVHLIPLLEDLHYGSTEAASMLGLMFLLSGIGRIITGFVVDLIDYRVVLTCLVGFQLLGLFILLYITPSSTFYIILFTLTFGIGFGGTIPLRPFVIMQIFGSKSFGSLQGLLQMGAIGAGVVGPIFYGWIFDLTASYNIAIYATIFTIIMTIPLIIKLNDPKASQTT